MPAKIEARRLSGVDLGKTAKGQDLGGVPFELKLRIIEHGPDSVQIWGPANIDGPRRRHVLAPEDAITITGKPS